MADGLGQRRAEPAEDREVGSRTEGSSIVEFLGFSFVGHRPEPEHRWSAGRGGTSAGVSARSGRRYCEDPSHHGCVIDLSSYPSTIQTFFFHLQLLTGLSLPHTFRTTPSALSYPVERSVAWQPTGISTITPLYRPKIHSALFISPRSFPPFPPCLTLFGVRCSSSVLEPENPVSILVYSLYVDEPLWKPHHLVLA